MTETDAAADRSVLVPGAHRLIRSVDGAEGPFSGPLVSHEDGVAVCVDTVELAGWGGWNHSGSEHVCGVLDLRRRSDGHDALLPWCTQRVETFVGRRRAAEVPLSPGELGTLVVSLLRGLRELGPEGAEAVGDWWLTGDGRPVFVHGDGGGARALTAGLVERIGGHTGDRATTRALGEIVTALRERRHHDDDEVRWEDQLLSIAAPRALQLDVFAPEKAADVASRRASRIDLDPATRTRRRGRARRVQRGGGRGRVGAVGRSLLERSTSVLASARDAVARRRMRTKKEAARSRRRPLIVAVSLAGVVLAAGLMWPEATPDEPAVAAQTATESPSADGDAVVEHADAVDEDTPVDESAGPGSTAPPPAAPDDALAALPAVLDAVSACVAAAADQCPLVLADGVAMPSGGAVTQGAGAVSATLIDDYGDIAVVKLTPTDGGEVAEQMIVLERREQKWLVRDVYDVAHQPDQ